MLQDRKIYCLQARPCIFQPGNVTGWGGEGVKYDGQRCEPFECASECEEQIKNQDSVHKPQLLKRIRTHVRPLSSLVH